MNYSTYIKEKLVSLINEMDHYHWLFTRNAEKDFSRIKKWSFGEIMRFIISMEGKSLKDELLEHFNFSVDTPTNSSFNQRRAQILPEAFEFLFREFTAVASGEKLFRGYRLLACDGSDLCIAHNPQDETTYFQSTPDSKGFNQMHLNALYDLLSRTYVDAIIQPARQENENKALCNMIDRYHNNAKTLFIADRGFESYNIFAHIQEKGMYYLIRVKDILSQGMASAARAQLPINKDSFDSMVRITLTNKQTKETRMNPEKYRMVMTNQHFDFLSNYQRFYDLVFRIVRFPLSNGSFECIITNLSQDDFSSDDIKDLYHMRWGIETSFRELKYAIGLVNFHAKKLDYIKSTGANAVWFTPVFISTPFENQDRNADKLDGTGYYTSDYFTIDPKFGTKAELKELVEKGSVHKTGLVSAKSHIKYAATLHLDYNENGKPILRPTFD